MNYPSGLSIKSEITEALSYGKEKQPHRRRGFWYIYMWIIKQFCHGAFFLKRQIRKFLMKQSFIEFIKYTPQWVKKIM